MKKLLLTAATVTLSIGASAAEVKSTKKNPLAGAIKNFSSSFNLYNYNYNDETIYSDNTRALFFLGTKILDDKLSATAEFSMIKREKTSNYVEVLQPVYTLMLNVYKSEKIGSFSTYAQHIAKYQKKASYTYVAAMYQSPSLARSTKVGVFSVSANAEYNELVRSAANKTSVSFANDEQKNAALSLANLPEDSALKVDQDHTNKETSIGILGSADLNAVKGLNIALGSTYFSLYKPTYTYVETGSTADVTNTTFNYDLNDYTETTLAFTYSVKSDVTVQLKGYYYNEGVYQADQNRAVIRSALYYNFL